MQAIRTFFDNGNADRLNFPDAFALRSEIEIIAAIIGSKR